MCLPPEWYWHPDRPSKFIKSNKRNDDFRQNYDGTEDRQNKLENYITEEVTSVSPILASRQAERLETNMKKN